MQMNEKKITARLAAYRSLMLCEKDAKYSNLEIDSAIRRFSLEGAEKGLFTALVYGAIERKLTLDYIISKLSSKPIESIDTEVMTLLRIGLYQLIWMDRIPESAAVNETVELAKKNAPRAASFVNALLRSFIRSYGRNALPYPDVSDRTAYLSVRYSVSPELIKIFDDSFDDAEQVLAAFEGQTEVTLRVNTLKLSRDELMEKLSALSVAAEATRYSPYGVKLKGRTVNSDISELISSGCVYIQDEASQIAVLAAAPSSGSTVIDTCACPGGKSFGAAILMENRGEVKSFDLHKNKLSLVEKGAQKLGIDIITTAEKNGSLYDESLAESADTVICDVPCSGLGVIAKKPEIRYKSAADIARLPEIQYSILKNSANYVKLGGVLCYSTCTLNRAENEAVVGKFLDSTSDFELCPFTAGGITADGGMLTLRPDIHNTDGFFVARLIRKK